MVKVLITNRQPLKVVGMMIHTNIQENKIPTLWEKFIARMDDLEEIAVPECSLGICLTKEDSELDDGSEFSYLAGVIVKSSDSVPEGMVFHQLPEMEVAVFTHVGSLDKLSETYNYIYEKWLPESGYELAVGDEVEWYDSRFKYDSADSQMDIHIPIIKVEKNDKEYDIFTEMKPN